MSDSRAVPSLRVLVKSGGKTCPVRELQPVVVRTVSFGTPVCTATLLQIRRRTWALLEQDSHKRVCLEESTHAAWQANSPD